MDRKKAERTAKLIADQINGPLGRVPMERVFAQHLEFFEELKALGATWPQIASLLDEAGIRRKDGKTLTAAQLRATISRLPKPKQEVQTTSLQKEEKPVRRPNKQHDMQKEIDTPDTLRNRMKRAQKSRP